MMEESMHAQKRRAQRNISLEDIDIVCRYGRKIRRTGAVFYFLARRDLPNSLMRVDQYRRLVGTTVIVSPEGEVITVYRNERAIREIQKKVKYRLVA